MTVSKYNLPFRAWNFFIRQTRKGIYHIILWIPYYHFVKNTRFTPVPCTMKFWFWQKVLGFNRKVYWPVHFTSKINQYKHIIIGVETNPGYEPGCYIQGIGKVYIGDYTRIAQNVGIISSNHDIYDNRVHDTSSAVIIGNYCWLGMNSVILPNVTLGDFTIVGAGSVVTKSFPEGYCVIAGNPARVIRQLEKEKCLPFHNQPEYIGYIRKEKFEQFRKNNLWI
jgi:acetyltransferase-like isoleucine patch superfamily enzyme